MISVSFTTPGKLNWLWAVVGFGGFELPELADAGLQSPGDLVQCGPATGVDGLRLHSTNNSMGDWVNVCRVVSRMYGQRVPHLRKLYGVLGEILSLFDMRQERTIRRAFSPQ